MPHPAPSPAAAARARLTTAAAYEVRPGRAEDRSAVIDLIAGRIAVLEDKRADVAPLKADSAAILNNLGEIENNEPLVWLLCEDDTIVGCAAVFSTSPPWAWGPSHRPEPTHYIRTLFTRHKPNESRARLLAWALLDRAARLPTKDGRTRWLRTTTSSDHVMRHACDAVGFAVFGGVMHESRLFYLLERPVQKVPGLDAYISTPPIT
ncbi:hypothetical protein ACFU99_34165 [Streptomyces sp. NPDC057654]|uniref:hypothetical protein n=1 Tax=Streptomyces sp. NPDC057654 TaxID=3346196 RepID=UPI0036C9F89B